MADACRLRRGQPRACARPRARRGWRRKARQGVLPLGDGFGLWVEQLLAESTGKHGRGSCPSGGPVGPDDVRLLTASGSTTPTISRASSSAGSLRRRSPRPPRDQSVRPARRAGREGPHERGARLRCAVRSSRRVRRRELFELAQPGDYVCIQAFVAPERRPSALERLRLPPRDATGCVVTLGYGPRYLHSTGQLHKAARTAVCSCRSSRTTGAELAIPGSEFGFARADRGPGHRRFRVAARTRPARRARRPRGAH